MGTRSRQLVGLDVEVWVRQVRVWALDVFPVSAALPHAVSGIGAGTVFLPVRPSSFRLVCTRTHVLLCRRLLYSFLVSFVSVCHVKLQTYPLTAQGDCFGHAA